MWWATNLNFKLSDFIKTYFDFAYYTATCPFRIVKDKSSGKFECKTWKFQQVICATLHITCAFRLLADVRNSLPPERTEPPLSYHHDPVQIFEMVSKIATMIYKLITFKRFWMNSADYVNVASVADQYTSTKSAFVNHQWILNKYTITLLYGLPTIEAVCRFFVIGTPLGMSSNFKWSPSDWLFEFVKYSRYMLRFEDEGMSSGLSFCDMDVLDGLFGLLTALATFERTLLSFYCDLSILASSLTLWLAAKAFSQELLSPNHKLSFEDHENGGGVVSPEIMKSSQDANNLDEVTIEVNNEVGGDLGWNQIYRKFKTIRLLSEAINKAVGSQVALFMVEVIMHYSIYLNGWLRSKDFYWRITWTLFYVVTCSVLIFSADVCTQMEAVKTWLTEKENIKRVPFEEAYLVLQQLSDKNIGVRGSNFFIVTYSLLGTSLGLIITFFIIFLQNNYMSHHDH